MKSGDINTAIADKAHKNNNGQAWSTPVEMDTKSGTYPHGIIDKTSDGFRVWNDKHAIWYWVAP